MGGRVERFDFSFLEVKIVDRRRAISQYLLCARVRVPLYKGTLKDIST